MTYAHIAAELLAEEELPGHGDRSSWYDAFLVRDRSCWLVAEDAAGTVAARVAADPSRILAERRRGPSAPAGETRGFVSPLKDGGLAVVGEGRVTVYDDAARARWSHAFEPWSDRGNASASCVDDASGRRLLVTTPGPDAGDGAYAGDLCVALDLADGRRVAHAVLPSATAGYAFQQSLTDPAQLLLNALQGDTFYGLEVSLRDDVLHVAEFGLENDPFAGVSLNGAVIKADVGGGWLSRWEEGRDDVVVEAEDVLPDDLCFAGHHAGFLDKDRVLSAVAAEPESTDTRHLVLDGHTLLPLAELTYPGTSCADPLALGDGTWLTVEGDVIRRWRSAG
ncbi:hypothetical protein AB0J38_35010 [Streptomyces sp. NPDC050095]|uniref:hypothetical protein n=1 Tax=unclassified Streptomyces TaxID=2593676 RepID=UPI00341D79AE